MGKKKKKKKNIWKKKKKKKKTSLVTCPTLFFLINHFLFEINEMISTKE